MAHMPINCFPRNVTLERNNEGYALLGEIDEHDVVEDVYLNLYDKNGNKNIYKNSEVDDTGVVQWNTSPIYNSSSKRIESVIKNFSTNIETPAIELFSANGKSYIVSGHTLKVPISTVYCNGVEQGTIYSKFNLRLSEIYGANKNTIQTYVRWDDNSTIAWWTGMEFIPNNGAVLFYLDTGSTRGFTNFQMEISNNDIDISLGGFGFHKTQFEYISNGETTYYTSTTLVTFGSYSTSSKERTPLCNVEVTGANAMEIDSSQKGYLTGGPSALVLTPKSLILGSNVNWSYSLVFRDYNTYILSGYTDSELKTIEDNTYIRIASASGVESGQRFNDDYLLEVYSKSKYYWAQRVEEVKKSGNETDGYTYTVQWTGEALPTDSKDYLMTTVNTYDYVLDSISSKSFTFKSSIDLLGEGVESARVVIILYTPYTYISLKDFNGNSVAITETFTNIEYTITSNVLEGEINSFKIEDSRPFDLVVSFNQENRKLEIKESETEYDLSWYQVQLKSRVTGETLLYSDKIFQNKIDYSYGCNWEYEDTIDYTVIYQFKNGILKEIKGSHHFAITSIEPEVIKNISKYGVEIPTTASEIYNYSIDNYFGDIRDYTQNVLKISTNGNITTYYQMVNGLKFERDENTGLLSFLDESNNEILTLEKSEVITYTHSDFIEVRIFGFPSSKHLVFKNNRVLFNDNEDFIDYGIQSNAHYDLTYCYVSYVATYSSDDESTITAEFYFSNGNIYLHMFNSTIVNQEYRVNQDLNVDGIDVHFGDNYIGMGGKYYQIKSFVPKVSNTVSKSYILDKVDFIPTCLFGTKYNYEENKENRYEVDESQIWYFDLDTKADSIDFVTEHSPQTTLSKIPKVGVSATNYMSQTITTKLGYLDEDDMYVGDNGWKLNKFAEWVNDGSVKILRLRNGYLIPVDIQLKSNVANHAVVGEPSDITFTWTQIADHKTAMLYGYK